MSITLTLTEAEARALRRALDNYLPELAEEAARIDRQPDAHELWDFYRSLQATRARLGAIDAGQAGAGEP